MVWTWQQQLEGTVMPEFYPVESQAESGGHLRAGARDGARLGGASSVRGKGVRSDTPLPQLAFQVPLPHHQAYRYMIIAIGQLYPDAQQVLFAHRSVGNEECSYLLVLVESLLDLGGPRRCMRLLGPSLGGLKALRHTWGRGQMRLSMP